MALFFANLTSEFIFPIVFVLIIIVIAIILIIMALIVVIHMILKVLWLRDKILRSIIIKIFSWD